MSSNVWIIIPINREVKKASKQKLSEYCALSAIHWTRKYNLMPKCAQTAVVKLQSTTQDIVHRNAKTEIYFTIDWRLKVHCPHTRGRHSISLDMGLNEAVPTNSVIAEPTERAPNAETTKNLLLLPKF